ncbi:hypothetical protein [Arthrobacter pigmenti]
MLSGQSTTSTTSVYDADRFDEYRVDLALSDGTMLDALRHHKQLSHVSW